MALIPVVGRKSWSSRILIFALYVILTIGAITMIYPFLIMLSTSVKSSIDVNNYDVYPKYLKSNSALFSKYVEIKYSGDIDAISSTYGQDIAQLEDVAPPQKTRLSNQQNLMVKDWNQFCKELPLSYKQANYGPIGFSPSKLLDVYREYLRKKFNNDINSLNRAYMEENASFEQVYTPFERPTKREWQPDSSAKMQDWLAFQKTLPADFLRTVGCDPLFGQFLKTSKYHGNISELNKAYGSSYSSFYDIHLPSRPPANPIALRQDWEDFVRNQLPFRYMEVSPKAVLSYRQFLSKRYSGDINRFNGLYKAHYASFNSVPLPHSAPAEGIALTDWMDFIAHSIPIEFIRPVNTEALYRETLLHKYGSLDAINRAYGTNFADTLEISPPYQLADWKYVIANRKGLIEHFLTRNYGLVISYILLHGRAVFNTAVYCFLIIITHLIVNPMCAYALSRYNLKYGYKILLFLLATMAFPAEVAMIPNFLLLKQFGMLNTYWALILPGMASGFSIFLLKGFFDSLPKELYEAGIIDGASEMRMFWKITIPLSKPIFAVIALQSFTAAYGAFMFAFLVCQNPKMWTMMVWLYELQITAPKYITMAALTVAAIPTLLVFIFTQNVIMRGIILPSYK